VAGVGAGGSSSAIAEVTVAMISPPEMAHSTAATAKART
jgi:hypothetical protein